VSVKEIVIEPGMLRLLLEWVNDTGDVHQALRFASGEPLATEEIKEYIKREGTCMMCKQAGGSHTGHCPRRA
jgi:hypothetical protein